MTATQHPRKKRLYIPLSREELDQVHRAALINSADVSAWARSAVLSAASSAAASFFEASPVPAPAAAAPNEAKAFWWVAAEHHEPLYGEIGYVVRVESFSGDVWHELQLEPPMSLKTGKRVLEGPLGGTELAQYAAEGLARGVRKGQRGVRVERVEATPEALAEADWSED